MRPLDLLYANNKSDACLYIDWHRCMYIPYIRNESYIQHLCLQYKYTTCSRALGKLYDLAMVALQLRSTFQWNGGNACS